MKKKRNLIIVIIILVFISLLYMFLTLLKDNETAEELGEEKIEILDRTDFESVEIIPFDEKPFTIKIDGSKGNINIEGYDESFEFDMALLIKLIGSLENLKAYDVIIGEVEKYGIDDKSPMVIIRFKDNSMLTLRYGAETKINQRVYMHINEHDKIYVVRKDIKEICNRSLYTFRKPQLTSPKFKAEDNLICNWIEIYGTEGNYIKIRLQTKREAQNSKSDAATMYIIESPFFWEAEDGRVFSHIINPVLSIENLATVVEDLPEDLTKYGISQDSVSIKLEINDRIINILFGYETENSYLYAFVENMNSVLKIPKELAGMLNLKWNHFLNTNLWMASIDKVKSFTLLTNERKYEVVLQRDEKGKLMGGLINNFSVDEVTIRDIYMMLLNIHIEGINSEEEKIASLEYKIKIYLLDGTDESFEFLLGKEGEYTIIWNGINLGFYTGRNSLVNFENSLKN